MSESEEDPYSRIFSTLKHPTRRFLLRSLMEAPPKRFSQLQAELHVDSPTLSYHLDALGRLVEKQNERYALTELGVAAYDLMGRVEDTRKRPAPHISQRIAVGLRLVMVLALLIWGVSALTTTISGTQVSTWQWHGIAYATPVGGGPPALANFTSTGYTITQVYSRPHFAAGVLTLIIVASYLGLSGYSFLQWLTSRTSKPRANMSNVESQQAKDARGYDDAKTNTTDSPPNTGLSGIQG